VVANERNNNRDTQIESTSEMTDLLEIYTLNIGSYQFEPRIINPTEGKNKENSLHTEPISATISSEMSPFCFGPFIYQSLYISQRRYVN